MARRLVLVLLLVIAVSAATVTPASAEQEGSKVRRLPAGFIDAGAIHTCAILTGGRLRCWGSGNLGRLGYGNTTTIGDNELPNSVTPVLLGAGRRARVIATGASHTCVILDNGKVRCWGDGANGRLGLGNITTIGDTEAPASVSTVPLGPGRRAVALSAGGFHTCAILDTGKVRCWGLGTFGRLGYGNVNSIGDNETPASAVPVSLGAGRAVAITAGGEHTCALLGSGKVRCWGRSQFGQLGHGTTSSIGDNELPSSVGPVALGTGRRAVAISATHNHTCALLDNGRVRCWGDGANGRLGLGNITTIGDNEAPASVGPVNLGTGRRAIAIAAGAFHTCALLDTRRVRCWGYGGEGRLGYGNTTTIGDNEVPASVGTVSLGPGRHAVAVTAGGFHTCVVLDTGRIRCWGENFNGQLGYGHTSWIGDNELPSSVAPVVVGALVVTKVRPTLTLALKPKHDGSAPYRFVARGKLGGFIGDPGTCTGKTTVRARKGSTSVVRHPKPKPLATGCSYAASFRVGAGSWKVTTTFAGNGSLRARTSTSRTFAAG
jgi:alpha-tubulin suppressor-like RCC1 family protein